MSDQTRLTALTRSTTLTTRCGIGIAGSQTVSSAEITNAIIVTMKSMSTPSAWDRSGPRMANPSNCVAVNVRLNSAFAAVN